MNDFLRPRSGSRKCAICICFRRNRSLVRPASGPRAKGRWPTRTCPALGASSTARAAGRVLLLGARAAIGATMERKRCRGCVGCKQVCPRHVEVGWPPGVLVPGVMRDRNESVADACGERPRANNAAVRRDRANTLNSAYRRERRSVVHRQASGPPLPTQIASPMWKLWPSPSGSGKPKFGLP